MSSTIPSVDDTYVIMVEVSDGCNTASANLTITVDYTDTTTEESTDGTTVDTTETTTTVASSTFNWIPIIAGGAGGLLLLLALGIGISCCCYKYCCGRTYVYIS